MTSGQFHRIPLSSITVPPRQRGDLGDIQELAESIGRIGLINPIVVTRELVLVAGERRLRAHQQLGLPDISVQYADEIDPTVLHTLELEENIKRKALTWQEEVKAVSDYHRLRSENSPVPWNREDTAKAIGVARRTVDKAIEVAREIEAGNQRIATAPKLSIAQGIVQRNKERAEQAGLVGLQKLTGAPVKEAAPASPILHADFHNWTCSYAGPRFNFIHCDFPYGVGMDKSEQGNTHQHGTYNDTPDVYWKLIQTLAIACDEVIAEHAHLMFWYSMKFHQGTIEALEDMGWAVNPFPLIWIKSDGAGIVPDPQRGPRRIYETALIASRGDRKITSPVANAYAAPTSRESHMSEKPEPMLRHFMRMFVDQHTSVLDPTCGSGAAIRAAASLNAHSVLGLEINEEFATEAQRRFADARKKEKANESQS